MRIGKTGVGRTGTSAGVQSSGVGILCSRCLWDIQVEMSTGHLNI